MRWEDDYYGFSVKDLIKWFFVILFLGVSLVLTIEALIVIHYFISEAIGA